MRAWVASAAASGFFSGARRLKSSSGGGFGLGGCDSGCGAAVVPRSGPPPCAIAAASRSDNSEGSTSGPTARRRATQVISVPRRALIDPLLDDLDRVVADGRSLRLVRRHGRPERRVERDREVKLPDQEAPLVGPVAGRHQDEVERGSEGSAARQERRYRRLAD